MLTEKLFDPRQPDLVMPSTRGSPATQFARPNPISKAGIAGTAQNLLSLRQLQQRIDQQGGLVLAHLLMLPEDAVATEVFSGRIGIVFCLILRQLSMADGRLQETWTSRISRWASGEALPEPPKNT